VQCRAVLWCCRGLLLLTDFISLLLLSEFDSSLTLCRCDMGA
jgi:hypothetical protein